MKKTVSVVMAMLILISAFCPTTAVALEAEETFTCEEHGEECTELHEETVTEPEESEEELVILTDDLEPEEVTEPAPTEPGEEEIPIGTEIIIPNAGSGTTEDVIFVTSPKGLRSVLYNSDTSASFTGKFGYQLDGVALEIYNSLVTHLYTNGETAGYDLTLNEPFIFYGPQDFGANPAYTDAVYKITRGAQLALDAFSYDYPQVFWMRVFSYSWSVSMQYTGDSQYKFTVSEVTITPYEAYTNSILDIPDFQTGVNDVLATLNAGMANLPYGNYYKVKYIHDYVCENSWYNSTDTTLYVHCAAPFFAGDGGHVCEGYAKAMKILLDRLGIPCVLVSGFANTTSGGGNHMWNYIQLEDGKWYLLDATWDDQDTWTYQTYMLVGSNSSGFYYSAIADERTPKGDLSNTSFYSFVYPPLSTTAANPTALYSHTTHTGIKHTGTPATCTESGIKDYYSCSCGKYFEDEACTNEVTNLDTWKIADPLGHNSLGTVQAAPATCTADGVNGGTYCSRCEYNKSAAEVPIPKLGHLWSTTYLVSNADDDKHYHVCTRTGCGEKDAGQSHNSNGSVNHVDETCITDGVRGGTYCTVCEYGKSAAEATITKLGHKWSTDYLAENADAQKHYHVCTNQGCTEKDAGQAHSWNYDSATEEHDKHCTDCQYVAEQQIPHTHVGTKVNGKVATCTQSGIKVYYSCSCGRNFEDEDCTKEIDNVETWKVIDPLGHNSLGSVTAVAATCTKSGIKGGTYCNRCNDGLTAATATIDPLGHSWSEEYSLANADAQKHYHVCTRQGCSAKDAGEAHNWATIDRVDATCENTGTVGGQYCTVCEYGKAAAEAEISKEQHSWSNYFVTKEGDNEKHYHKCTVCNNAYDDGETHNTNGSVAAVAATCITDGVKGGTYCNICNYGKDAAEATITKLGHQWSTDYLAENANDQKHYHVCTRQGCSAKDAGAAHNWATIDHVNATCERTGTVGGQYCTVCEYGKAAAEAEISKEEHSWSNYYVTKEGDNEKHYHKCTVCNNAYDDGETHNTNGSITSVPASCELPGKYGGTYCTACQYGFAAANATITALGHDWSTTYLLANADAQKHYHVCTRQGCSAKDAGVDHNTNGSVAHVNATCTANGVEGGTYCTVCNYGKAAAEATITKLEHQWSTTYLAVNADAQKHYHVCTRDGCNEKDSGQAHSWNYESATEDHDKHCTVCQYVAQNKLDHTHSGTYHAGTAATCTASGIKEYYSCRCGKNFEDSGCTREINNVDTWKVIDPLEHQWSETYLLANSDDQKHYHVCTRQGCSAKDAGVDHNTNGSVAHVNATCTANGVEGGTYCTICNYGKAAAEATITKLEHQWSTDYLAVNADAQKHYHVCTRDGCNEKDSGQAHSWNYESATEDHDKHCTACQYVAQNKLDHTHSGTYHAGTAATCTASGIKEYYSCRCGKNFEDSGCTREINNVDTWKVIDPLEHQWSETYLLANSDDQKHYHVCTRQGCSAKDEGEAHSWNYDSATEEHDKHCTICEYVIEERLGVCTGTKTVSPKEGTLSLTISNINCGWFTFTSYGSGWAIKSDSGYLTVSNGKLTYTEEPSEWTYSGNALRQTEVKLNRNGRVQSSRTYYLTADRKGLNVSTRSTRVTLSETVNYASHSWTAAYYRNGTHTVTCANCGEARTEGCNYGAWIQNSGLNTHTHSCTVCSHSETADCTDNGSGECSVCGGEYLEPSLSANVTVTTRTTGGRRPRTTYVATITAEAVGMQVTRVEYSTNGRRWTRATSYTSNSEIKALYVRLNGTEVFYFDGTETKHV